MTPVQKALWFIESHSSASISLDDVAECAGVSRFHLLRAFAAATGLPIMRYLRGRRLTDAARRLAEGADDILSVALDAGYGSHEALTRAFRDQFGTTPEAIRRQGALQGIELLEALRMADTPRKDLAPPRFENGRTLLVAGIVEHYDGGSSHAGIPAQWQKLHPHLGNIPGQVGPVAYGVVYNTVARAPIAGAVLTMRAAGSGAALSAACFEDTAQQGQVRLYDLTREPSARRAILTFDPGWLFGPNERFTDCSDVAFTPDGRRVVGIGMLKIRIWDAATGAEQDAFEMMDSGSLNRLAISPDGRWLAVTTPFGAGVVALEISPPGP